MRRKATRNGESAIRREFQNKKPTLKELLASGRYTSPMPQGDYLEFARVMFALRTARRKAGLSLADMSKLTGIDKAALSRLENGVADNPTIGTINRYAAALGKSLLLKIAKRAGMPRPGTRVRSGRVR